MKFYMNGKLVDKAKAHVSAQAQDHADTEQKSAPVEQARARASHGVELLERKRREYGLQHRRAYRVELLGAVASKHDHQHRLEAARLLAMAALTAFGRLVLVCEFVGLQPVAQGQCA